MFVSMLGIKTRSELDDRSCPGFLAGVSSECKYRPIMANLPMIGLLLSFPELPYITDACHWRTPLVAVRWKMRRFSGGVGMPGPGLLVGEIGDILHLDNPVTKLHVYTVDTWLAWLLKTTMADRYFCHHAKDCTPSLYFALETSVVRICCFRSDGCGKAYINALHILLNFTFQQ